MYTYIHNIHIYRTNYISGIVISSKCVQTITGGNISDLIYDILAMLITENVS